MVAMLSAASDLARLPAWFQHHKLQMTSPAARQVLWAWGRRLTQNPDLGFAFAERVPEDALGSVWQIYEVAPNLRTLIEEYNDWSALLLEFMEMSVVDHGSLTWFRMTSRDGIVLDRAEQDYRAAMMLKVFRRLLHNPALAPRAVHFAYAPPRTRHAHLGALGTAQIRFAQPCLQVALSRMDADSCLEGAQPEAFKRLSTAARILADSPRERSFSARVETLITERLIQDASEISIARDLGLSARSLRRRLAEGGVTYRSLLDRARRREGDLYLEDAALPIARVARLLGFANGGALRNSMRRWSALNPGQRRRAVAQPPTSADHPE
jgi:AraC-like DNA-binding protein